jgi:hypothetical protein
MHVTVPNLRVKSLGIAGNLRPKVPLFPLRKNPHCLWIKSPGWLSKIFLNIKNDSQNILANFFVSGVFRKNIICNNVSAIYFFIFRDR